MRILYNDTSLIDEEYLAILEKAADLCAAREGLDPAKGEVSVSFVDAEEIHRLNRMYREVDSPTDVLSFPLLEDISEAGDREYLLGDVVICTDIAKEQAKEYGHGFKREVVYLFVHSMFHLLGYDHMEEDEKKEMRTAEEEIMEELEIER